MNIKVAGVLFKLCFIISCTTIKPFPLEHDTENSAMKENLIETILSSYPEQFDSIIKQNDQWQVQIIYTQIDRTKDNKPVFTEHRFNIDTTRYFYPASTVKMPIAFLALQKLNELKIPGLDMNTTMITEADFPGHTPVYNDPDSEDGRPTIANYIRKIFLVSDNDAFNRLYEFLGQEYINENLHAMGYHTAQVLHRLEVLMDEDQHRTTNPIKFLSNTGRLLYEQPMKKSRMAYQQRNTFLGKGYYKGGQLIDQPFDFSRKNRITLPDLHSVLQSVIFPNSVPAHQRFNLTASDYKFLHRYMSMKPSESRFPQYDETYTDAYVKFLMFGADGPIADSSIRIFNKVGDAYGFLTDVAYIVDHTNKVEFMLSATIHCNPDGIYNDNQYAYNTVGFPFLKNLGLAFYRHELKRNKKNLPDLSAFLPDYRQ
jgi:hypothetical protein